MSKMIFVRGSNNDQWLEPYTEERFAELQNLPVQAVPHKTVKVVDTASTPNKWLVKAWVVDGDNVTLGDISPEHAMQGILLAEASVTTRRILEDDAQWRAELKAEIAELRAYL